MKGQNKITEKKKITELNLLLKEKEQEVSIAKQKAGFFARKYAEASEKLEKIKNGKKK